MSRTFAITASGSGVTPFSTVTNLGNLQATFIIPVNGPGASAQLLIPYNGSGSGYNIEIFAGDASLTAGAIQLNGGASDAGGAGAAVTIDGGQGGLGGGGDLILQGGTGVSATTTDLGHVKIRNNLSPYSAIFIVDSMVTADRTFTFPDASGTFMLTSGAAGQFSDNETPSGSIDGSNTAFTLSNSPSPAASLQLIYNGQFQLQGTDYTLSGNAITFTSAPVSGTWLRAFYRY